MKKYMLLAALAIPMMASADSFPTPPENGWWLEGYYILKISPNGEWAGGLAGDHFLYNVQAKEIIPFVQDNVGGTLGLGNCIANNGMVVGSANDVVAVMVNGETVFPRSLTGYSFCNLDGITPDATRVCGIVNNPDKESETDHVPIYCDIQPDGTIGEPQFLPYPEFDFFGSRIQRATAVWISDDGSTILGEMVDWKGDYTVPIVYTQDNAGEWTYSLPTKPLFNPTHIEMPPFPWANEPEFPEPENYMGNVSKARYQAAMDYYENYGGVQPDPFAYMTPQEIDEYNEGVIIYNTWFDENEQAIIEYNTQYYKVLQNTPSFAQNAYSLKPDGSLFSTKGGERDAELNFVSKIYTFQIPDGSYRIYDIPDSGLYPSQVLSDGTIVCASPMNENPMCYLKFPGRTEFTPLKEFLSTDYPEIVEWMNQALITTGLVSMSDDMSVFTGACVPGTIKNYDDAANYFYNSYLFTGMELSGVKEVKTLPLEEGVLRVYNLQGVKVLETKDANAVNTLDKGIYIVNGKKTLVK